MTTRRRQFAISLLGAMAVLTLGTAGAAFASEPDERPLPVANGRHGELDDRTDGKLLPAEPRLGSAVGKRQRGFDVPPGHENRPDRGGAPDRPGTDVTPAPTPTGDVLGATPPTAAERSPVPRAPVSGRADRRRAAATAVNRRQPGPIRMIEFGPQIAGGERGAAVGGFLGVVNVAAVGYAAPDIAATRPGSTVGAPLLGLIVACQVLGAVVGTHLARRALAGPVVVRRL